MANGSGMPNWVEMVGKLGFGVIVAYILFAVLNKQAEQQAVRDEKMYELMVERSNAMTDQFKRIADVSVAQQSLYKEAVEQSKQRNEFMRSFIELERSSQTFLRELLKDRK